MENVFSFWKYLIKIFIIISLMDLNFHIYAQLLNSTSPTLNSTEAPKEIKGKLHQFDSATLIESFPDCSSRCASEPSCVGITIFKAFKNNPPSSNSSASIEEDLFWCVTDLSESEEDLTKGEVVSKVMLRDKLQKVLRVPLPYRRPKTKREAPPMNSSEILVPVSQNVSQPQSSVKEAAVLVDAGQPQITIQNDSQPQSNLKEAAVLVDAGQPQITIQNDTLPQSSVKEASVLVHAGPPQVTIQKEVPNRFEIIPPQKTLEITVPNAPIQNLTTTIPTILPTAPTTTPIETTTLFSGELNPDMPVATLPVNQSQQQVNVSTSVVGQGTVQGCAVTNPAVDIRIMNNCQTTGVETQIANVSNIVIESPPSSSSSSIQIPTVAPSSSASAASISIIVPGEVSTSTTTTTTNEPTTGRNKVIVQIFPPTEIKQSIAVPSGNENVPIRNVSSSVQTPIPGVLLSISKIQVPEEPNQPQRNKIESVGVEAINPQSGAVEGEVTDENLEQELLRVRDLLSNTLNSISYLLENLPKVQGAGISPINETTGLPATNISGISIHKEGSTIVIDVDTASSSSLSSITSSASTEPSPSEQLEGENVEFVESTEIPTETPQVTVPPFPILRPSSTKLEGEEAEVEENVESATEIPSDSSPQSVSNFETREEGKEEECVFSDKERFKRDILSTSFSMLDNQPTMLTFVNGSTCIGTFSKTGKKGVRCIKQILPDFPYTDRQVAAGTFHHDTLHLFDSSEEQTVWNFHYDEKSGAYLENQQEGRTSSENFLAEFCGIHEAQIHVKAIVQYSADDASCIVFDRNGKLHLSPNPSESTQDLVDSILYVMRKEFVDHVQSIFAWLDEPVVNKVYLFGTNQEVYEIFRDESTQFKWLAGSYRVVPYEEFPYR